MGNDLTDNMFETDQAAVVARLDELFLACAARDFGRLSALHLAGPKFSKFDDVEPFDRQDAEVAMRSEVEQLRALQNVDCQMEDVKVDVFGEVAVVTGIWNTTYRFNDEPGRSSSRSTLVFVRNSGDWLIAHEHHSPKTPSTKI